MEPSACERFFKVPELVLLLITHLEPRDISRFMLINHAFHSFCIPTLYHALTLNYTPEQSNLLHSAAATFMLAKHTRHVHKLHCGVLELVYFSIALLAFDDIKSQVTGTPPPNRPNWLPARDTLLTCQLIPLPTMDCLTVFVLDVDIEFSSRVLQQCPYYIAGCERRRDIVYWICWLLRRIISSSSSSHLKNPTINSLYVPLEPIVVLSPTIKLLTGLRRLELGLRCFPWVRLSIQSILLHCCPSLLELQEVDVRLVKPDPFLQLLEDVDNDSDEDEDGMRTSRNEDEGEVPGDSVNEDEEIRYFGTGDGAEGGDLIAAFGNERLTKRTESIFTLKTLWLWDLVGCTMEGVRAIFEKYPNIEQLLLPNIYGTYDVDGLARTIVALCPKLRTFQFYGEGSDTNISFLSKSWRRCQSNRSSKSASAYCTLSWMSRWQVFYF
ncbi:hypothetical protein BGZ89_005655 [Linnemannia elongata]|nr:hypothetical protein BGZ89_005655 [Linnemannia elongata]